MSDEKVVVGNNTTSKSQKTNGASSSSSAFVYPQSYPKNGILLPLQHFTSTSLESLIKSAASSSGQQQQNHHNHPSGENNNNETAKRRHEDDVIYHIVSNFVTAEKEANGQLFTLLRDLYCPLTGSSFEAIMQQYYISLQQQQDQTKTNNNNNIVPSKQNLHHQHQKVDSVTSNTFREMMNNHHNASPKSGASPLGPSKNENEYTVTNSVVPLPPPTTKVANHIKYQNQPQIVAPTLLSSMDKETMFANFVDLFKCHTTFVENLTKSNNSNDGNQTDSSGSGEEQTSLFDPGNVLSLTLGLQSFTVPLQQQQQQQQTTIAHRDPNATAAFSNPVSAVASNQHSRKPSSTLNPSNQNNSNPLEQMKNSSNNNSNSNNNNNVKSKSGVEVVENVINDGSILKHNRYISTGQFTSISQAQQNFGHPQNQNNNNNNNKHFRQFSGLSNNNNNNNINNKHNESFNLNNATDEVINFPTLVDNFIQELYLFGINFYKRSAPMIIRLIEVAVSSPPYYQFQQQQQQQQQSNNNNNNTTSPGYTNHHYNNVAGLKPSSSTDDLFVRNNSANNNNHTSFVDDPSQQNLSSLFLMTEDVDYYNNNNSNNNSNSNNNNNSNTTDNYFTRLAQQQDILSRKFIQSINTCAEQYEKMMTMLRKKNNSNQDSSSSSAKPNDNNNNHHHHQQKNSANNSVVFSEILTLLPEMDSQLLQQISSTLLSMHQRQQQQQQQQGEKKEEKNVDADAATSTKPLSFDGSSSSSSASAFASTATSMSSLPLHWLLFLLATPIRSMRRLYTFAQDILACFATASFNSSTVYSLNPESDMLYLTQLIRKLEVELLEFDAVCYESCTTTLTKNTLKRLDFAVSSSSAATTTVVNGALASTSSSSSDSHRISVVPLVNPAASIGKLSPHPNRVLLLRGYVQKKIPGGRHPKILFLFDDVLIYGEENSNGNGRIKITTVLPLIIVSKKTVIPLVKKEITIENTSSENKDNNNNKSEPGFFAKFFGFGGNKNNNSNNNGNEAATATTNNDENREKSTSSEPNHNNNASDTSPLAQGKNGQNIALLNHNNNNNTSATTKNHNSSSSSSSQATQQLIFEPHILHVRDVPDDVVAGVVPSAFDQGASTQATDTTATYFRTNAFEVLTKNRSYVFFTPTVTEKDQWLAALRFAMENARKRAVENNTRASDSLSSALMAMSNNNNNRNANKDDDDDVYNNATKNNNDEENARNKVRKNIIDFPEAAKETCSRLTYLKSGYTSEADSFRQLMGQNVTLQQQQHDPSQQKTSTRAVFDGCAVPLALFPSSATNSFQQLVMMNNNDNNSNKDGGDDFEMQESANRRLEKLVRKSNSRFTSQMCKTISVPQLLQLGNSGAVGWTTFSPSKQSDLNNNNDNNCDDDDDDDDDGNHRIDLFAHKNNQEPEKKRDQNDDDDDDGSALGSTIREITKDGLGEIEPLEDDSLNE